MSSPFSKNFINKRSSLFMTQKQEDTFGPEGSNPNPEIYQGIKSKDTKDESTPLSMDAFQAGYGAKIYASNREGLQNMFNQLTDATVKAVEARKNPEAVAERLEKRVERRNDRAYKKGKATKTRTVDLGPNPLDPSSSSDRKISVTIKGDAKRDKFDKKTAKIKSRLTSAKEKAKKAMEKRIQDAAALRGTKTNEQKIADARELKEMLNKPENQGLEDFL